MVFKVSIYSFVLMKSLIIKKANSLFLKYGFKSVTMDELALSLGMSKKTLYIHFDCKNDIVEASALDIFEKANKELILVRKKSENAIHEFHSVKYLIMKYLNDSKLSPHYQLQKYYPEIHEKIKSLEYKKFKKQVKKNILNGINAGLFRKNINIEFLTRLYLTGMSNLRDIKIFDPEKFNISELIENYLEYHLRAIVSDKGLNLLNKTPINKIDK